MTYGRWYFRWFCTYWFCAPVYAYHAGHAQLGLESAKIQSRPEAVEFPAV